MFTRLQGRKPVLFLSGGLDSLLLLVLLIEQKQVFEIIQYRDHWTKKQRERADYWIRKCNLRVYSYPPLGVNLLGDDTQLSVVFEYAIGNGAIPVIRDVIDGTTCIADLDGQRMHTMPLDVDLGLIGTRSDDYHPFMGQPVNEQEFEVGGMQFICPLWNHSREDVKRELESRGIDTSEVDEDAESGNIAMCNICIKGTGKVWCPRDEKEIDSIVWDRQANLKAFREAYGF